jgi:predicted nucleotidyltransferase
MMDKSESDRGAAVTNAVGMSDRDRAILAEFACRLRALYPDAKIWAYGSRARGDGGEWSDLDLCIVLPTVTREIEKLIGRIAWEVGFEQPDCLHLSPLVMTRDSFEAGPMSASTLVANILREGVGA